MIISNNVAEKFPLNDNDLVRINLAWFKTKEQARAAILNSRNGVYLDFPDGRTKPPKPSITLDEAVELARQEKVKYFAVSNVESIVKVSDLQERIRKPIVPKIETLEGVKIIPELIDKGIEMIMLDKEDLYSNVKNDSFLYELLVDKVRSYGARIKVLELRGVIFE